MVAVAQIEAHDKPSAVPCVSREPFGLPSESVEWLVETSKQPLVDAYILLVLLRCRENLRLTPRVRYDPPNSTGLSRKVLTTVTGWQF